MRVGVALVTRATRDFHVRVRAVDRHRRARVPHLDGENPTVPDYCWPTVPRNRREGKPLCRVTLLRVREPDKLGERLPLVPVFWTGDETEFRGVVHGRPARILKIGKELPLCRILITAIE